MQDSASKQALRPDWLAHLMRNRGVVEQALGPGWLAHLMCNHSIPGATNVQFVFFNNM